MSRLFELYGVKVKKGEIIFNEGDAGNDIYMIQKGKVKIAKMGSHVGEEISVLEDLEFFGEMAIINSEPRSASAIALEDCELIRMDRYSFEDALKDNPSFGQSVVRMLTRRIRDTNQLVTALFALERKNRVMMYIFQALIRKGKKDKSGAWIIIELEEFAQDIIAKEGIDYDTLLTIIYDLVKDEKFFIKKSAEGRRHLSFQIL